MTMYCQVMIAYIALKGFISTSLPKSTILKHESVFNRFEIDLASSAGDYENSMLSWLSI